ncbi:MAG: ParB/RepB/Spo0J family partition protein [Alphaproteobacteria bacterium]
MSTSPAQAVHLIPIDQITVVNPRVRNKKVFKEIVSNIAELGLKRPITVARRDHPDGPRYDLVCGQGRLEAFQSLGQQEIPALVVEASNEDCLVMSLVENLARRQHHAIDLLHDIEGLKKRGYDEPEIAGKTGLSIEYVRDVIRLLQTKEHRLLRAVESGQIPVSVAVEIAMADDSDVQQVLRQAYESKVLRGRKLVAVKRLIEKRRLHGKGRKPSAASRERPLSVERLLRTYRDDTDKKRRLVRKAETTRDCLIFVTEGLRKLFADAKFIALLQSEGLESVPQNLAARLNAGSPHG